MSDPIVRKHVSPLEMATGSRLDIFARTDFVLSTVTGLGKSWSLQLYRSYLNAAGISSNDKEDDKESIMDYISSFSELINSMINDGFDEQKGSIPVGDAGIINGAHRVATALVLDREIVVQRTEDPASIIDYRWLEKSGLNQDYINYMAFELLRRKPNARAYVIFDIQNHLCDKLEREIRIDSDIVIRRRILLTEVGKRRIISLLYDYNEWWSADLLEQFVIERFDGNESIVDIIFTLENNLSERQTKKEDLRSTLANDIFERKIHGTDDYFDTLWLAESVLNANSIAFLNCSPIGSEDELLRRIGKPLQNSQTNRLIGDWCIDGSAVLELHGLRPANDIDYIYYGQNFVPVNVFRNGDCHNSHYELNSVPIDEIIFNPRMHFYFKGIKFISLSMLLQQKFETNSENSLTDCHLIFKLRSDTPTLYFNTDARKLAFRVKLMTKINRRADRWLRKLPNKIEMKLRKNINSIKQIFV